MPAVPVSYLLERADDALPAALWLTEQESERDARFRFDPPRANWRLGRWTAKQALALALGIDPMPDMLRRFEVLPAPDGAPEATLDGDATPLVLSLSHSQDRGLCMLVPRGARLGCDIEWIEPRSDALVETFFTASEQQQWHGAARPDLLATLIWSAKESALKLLREGLRLDTRSVEVTADPEAPGGPWHALSVRYADASRPFKGWWRTHAGFVMTTVAEPEPAVPEALAFD